MERRVAHLGLRVRVLSSSPRAPSGAPSWRFPVAGAALFVGGSVRAFAQRAPPPSVSEPVAGGRSVPGRGPRRRPGAVLARHNTRAPHPAPPSNASGRRPRMSRVEDYNHRTIIKSSGPGGAALARHWRAVRPHRRHPKRPTLDHRRHRGSAWPLLWQRRAVLARLQSQHDIAVVEREKGSEIARRVRPGDAA